MRFRMPACQIWISLLRQTRIATGSDTPTSAGSFLAEAQKARFPVRTDAIETFKKLSVRNVKEIAGKPLAV